MIKEIIEKQLENPNELGERVFSFHDFQNKFIHLKNRAYVTLELTDGKEIKLDISDLIDFKKGV